MCTTTDTQPGPGSVIALAPIIDLHAGVHDPILLSPPAGYRVEARDATHTFLFPDKVGSPHALPHWGELVEVGGPRAGVHTARWPVVGAPAWVADMDDFGYPVLCGRHAVSSAWRAAFRQEWPAAMAAAIMARAENMLTAYAHPSCKAVLVHSRAALQSSSNWLQALGLGRLGEAFLAKARVIYPAQQVCERAVVEAKWSTPSRIRVLFCGREFEPKNGLLALEVMARVRRALSNVDFVYVGPIPEAAQRRYGALLAQSTHFEAVPHKLMLRLMEGTHVFFHPSRSESVGVVLLEAAAAGAAVVAAKGRGMDSVPEIFGVSLFNRNFVAGFEI